MSFMSFVDFSQFIYISVNFTIVVKLGIRGEYYV